MERLHHSMSHDWHVQINRFNDGKHGDDRASFMYEAKTLADEVPRLAMLFKMERTDTLTKTHQTCSCCAPKPIAKNELTCCLGTKCAACPMLHALDNVENATPDQIDMMKAWTCAAHIVSEGGDMAGEGYILTTDDRMYWDGVYESLAQSDDGAP